ncbi:MAG: glutamate synthase [Proteobacteria bacterium]|nr:MAG: glutamate synthase [Pseudomonadota bacterium]
MGKVTGFKQWGRRTPATRDAGARTRDFKEFVAPFDPEVVHAQGGRCMDCGVPFCMQGCPLGNRIPDWNDLVYRDRWRQAFVALESTNNFPEFTGRLCPAPCEGACVLAVNQDPVTIELIEKEIIERAWAEGWVTPRPPRQRTGKTVGIVGSGPAGLAAAAQLNQAGHRVTVYEKADRVGGLLRYGIPDFKLDKSVIDRRVEVLAAEGIRFETGVHVGVEPTWGALKARHDAVVIAIGAERARDLDVPGRELSGVHLAMDFLPQQNRRVAGSLGRDEGVRADGRDVVILGGGDTGSDCLGTSLRHGAKSVTQIELMPAPPDARADDNPWPQWPMVFRTSSSQAEGGAREFGILTRRLVGDEAGRIKQIEAVRVSLERGDDGRSRFVEQEGGELTLPCDLLILALGFLGPVTEALVEQLEVALTPRGAVAVDERFMTSAQGVFAAGDVHRGASLIVWAISEGREAARAVDVWLRGEGAVSTLPTRGMDRPFGGR